MRWRDRLFTMRELADDSRLRTPAWLSCGEAERFRTIHDERSSLRWLTGRYAVKTLLGELTASMSPWSDLHVESRNGRGRMSRPTAHLRGRLQPWSLALTHTDDYVYVAAALSANVELGVDVVEAESVASEVIEFWFTPGEIDWCRRMSCSTAPALVWSLKEAWYKAGNCGEAFAPRGVDVCELLPDDAVILAWLAERSAQGSMAWTQNDRWISVQRHGSALATLVVGGRRRRGNGFALPLSRDDSRASDSSSPIGAICFGS
jgi:phosphopantetheinyl transferase